MRGGGRGEERNKSGKVLAAESAGSTGVFPFLPHKEAFLEAPEEDRGLGMKTCDRKALRACPEPGARAGVWCGGQLFRQADGSLTPHSWGLLPSLEGSGVRPFFGAMRWTSPSSLAAEIPSALESPATLASDLCSQVRPTGKDLAYVPRTHCAWARLPLV